MPRQTWIADRCRSFGLTVEEVQGWRTRGSESFNPAGVICHHTAGPRTGDMPSLNVLINGRSDLPGPLANVGLGRSGKVYVVAAGRANHAGTGGWRGLAGNSSVLGIEAENVGTSAEPWQPAMLAAYHRLAAALISGTTLSDVRNVCGHKEWAPNRKIDPHTLNMSEFRDKVKAVLVGGGDTVGELGGTPLGDQQKDQLNAILGAAARVDADTDMLGPMHDRLIRLETKMDQLISSGTGGGGGGGGVSLEDLKRAVREVLVEGTGGTP